MCSGLHRGYRTYRRAFVETFVVATTLAAVGVCLKPQHVLDVIVVELLVLIRLRSVRRWFQPALVALVAGPVLYLLAVRIFSPSYLRDIMPLLTETYWGFNKTWSAMAHAATKQASAFALALILYIGLRRRLRAEPIIACLLAAATGAMLAYAQQHKGWGYQLLALQICSYLAVALICCDVAERMWLQWSADRRGAEVKQLRTSICVGLAVLAFVIALSARLWRTQPIPYFETQKIDLATIYSEYPPGTAVGLLAVEPWEWPEVLDQNKIWASRYMHLWPLPAIVRSQDPLDADRAHHLPPAKIAELSSLLRRTTAEDLAHWTPQSSLSLRSRAAIPTSVPRTRAFAIPACSTGSNAIRSFETSGRIIAIKRRSPICRSTRASSKAGPTALLFAEPQVGCAARRCSIPGA